MKTLIAMHLIKLAILKKNQRGLANISPIRLLLGYVELKIHVLDYNWGIIKSDKFGVESQLSFSGKKSVKFNFPLFEWSLFSLLK